MDKNFVIGIFGAGFGLLTWTYTPLPEVLTHYGPWVATFMMAYAALHLLFDHFDPPIKGSLDTVKLRSSPVRPDYAKWDKLSDFRLDHVACLWIDREPSQHLDSDETAVFKKLEDYITSGALGVKRDDLREVISDAFRKSEGHVVKANPEWRADRSSLLSLAVKLGEKPPFLFKKERVK